MKKAVALILLTHLCASAGDINFSGLKRKAETAADNVSNLIDGLIDGNREQVDVSYTKIQEIDPELARVVKIDELKAPCSRCNSSGITVTGKACGKCDGTRLMTDENSLRFFMDRFSIALNKGAPISGTAGPDGTYSYTNSLGETNTVPSYTASLWGN